MDNVAGAGLPKSFPGQPRKQGLAGMRNTESPAKSAFCAHQLIQDTRGVDQDDDANAGRIGKERYISDYPLSSVDYLSVPYVEAAVVRIVGSPYFESFGEMNHDTSVDDEAVQHHVLMYISGTYSIGNTGFMVSILLMIFSHMHCRTQEDFLQSKHSWINRWYYILQTIANI